MSPAWIWIVKYWLITVRTFFGNFKVLNYWGSASSWLVTALYALSCPLRLKATAASLEQVGGTRILFFFVCFVLVRSLTGEKCVYIGRYFAIFCFDWGERGNRPYNLGVGDAPILSSCSSSESNCRYQENGTSWVRVIIIQKAELYKMYKEAIAIAIARVTG